MFKKSNRVGPIASSYNELQGIENIEKSFTKGINTLDDDHLFNRTILQCSELTFMNIEQLVERQTESIKKNRMSPAVQHSNWVYSLLKISHQLLSMLHSETQHNKHKKFYSLESISYNNYLSKKSILNKSLTNIFSSKRATASVVIGLPGNPFAKLAQNTKLEFQLNCFINGSIIYFKNPSFSNYINYDCLTSAFRNPSINGDTYFTQFRLLHQIPELLGLYCIHKISLLKKNNTDALQILDLLNQTNSIIQIIIQCLYPLLENMTPSEYHLIRENLGKTSGSLSETLAKKLFKSEFIWIKDQVKNILTIEKDKQLKKILSSAFCRYQSKIIQWRELHIGFPRNVLGGPSTKSLIGANDSIAAVDKMRKSFINDHTDISLDETHNKILYESGTVDLDRLLLKITADETIKRFPDVQQRRGPVFGKEGNIND